MESTQYLTIRLRPDRPISAEDFRERYLTGLSITAYDRTFKETEPGKELGTAKYDANFNKSAIIQHYRWDDLLTRFFSIATAYIEFPAASVEHRTSDIHLKVTRGKLLVGEFDLGYNVALGERGCPELPPKFPKCKPEAEVGFVNSPTSAHLILPSSDTDYEPGDTGIALMTIMRAGTKPPFEVLKKAVETVLADDPQDISAIESMTVSEARHVAHEIVWNRKLFPLPNRTSNELHDWYTADISDSNPTKKWLSDAERRKFDVELLGYHSIHNAEAEQLANYVYSLSAALQCAELSSEAKRVVISVPISPGLSSDPSRIRAVDVLFSE